MRAFSLRVSILLFIFFNAVVAHQQILHQYITREAFKLLCRSYPQLANSEMASYIGTNETSGSPYVSWGAGTIVSGAWIEDEYDIVDHYGIGNVPNFDEWSANQYYALFGDERAAFTSITHFWNADAGATSTVTLTDVAHPLGIASRWRFSIPENAMQKMYKYLNGEFDNRLVFQDYGGFVGCDYACLAADFKMSNLFDLYRKAKQIQAFQYHDVTTGVWLPTTCPTWDYATKWVYEQLGRMCHLLEDQSVPAHIHCDSHACTSGMYCDYYEDNAPYYHMWTADEVFISGGTYIYPYNNWGDPLYYLMYLMNEATDHYADGVTNGDDNYDSNCPGLSEIISSEGLPTQTSQVNDANCRAMHDKLFPLVIRATAGLLYWFAKETGQIPAPVPFSVNVVRTFDYDSPETFTPQNSPGGCMVVSVPQPYMKNSHNYFFTGWNDGVTDNPRIVCGSMSLVANYKRIHISNDPSAFTNNSQRKLVETPETGGWMWQTYTSVIGGYSHVFLEYSTNSGGTWQIMKTSSGSSYLDWTGQGKCPSLDWWDPGAGRYVVTVVFQSRTSNGKYEIDHATFMREPTSGAYSEQYWGTIYTEPSNGDSYSVNANPAIAFGHGVDGSQPSFVVAFERKSLSNSGIDLKWGSLNYAGSLGLYVKGGTSNSQQVTYTNASSCKPTICGERTTYPPRFHLAYEQDVSQYTSTIQYRLLSLSNAPDYSQCSEIDSRPLSNSSYMINIWPCITVMNGDWYASWLSQANPSIAARCAYTNLDARFSNLWYYYGVSASSTSINVSNDNTCCYVAWNDFYSNKNQLVNTANPGALANLNTSGPDIQMSNGPSHNSMYVSSYYRSSSPYYWLTSFRLGAAGLGKASPVAIASGRGCTVNDGDANFIYTFGDLNVDGQNVEFVDVPDSIKFTNIDSINSFLLTQPFNLTKDSKVVFTEMSGFADSSGAINTLGKKGFVGYRVELINDGTNRVAGTLKNIKLTASSLHSTGMTYYSLDAKKIQSGTYRMRITVSTNQDSAKFSLVEQHALENLATVASSQSLTLQTVDIILDYALGQNYPNPFNPSTMINYQLPTDGHVTLKVYDVLGREVRTLVNENQQVGRYSITLDGSGLASGVYFYRLTSGNYVSTKKMLIVK